MREGLQKIVSDDETIVAIATPVGHSGIGIVRASGQDCLNLVRRCFTPSSLNSDLRHRVAMMGRWSDREGKELDQVLVTFFRAPNSYTGEDVLEISGHGNPLVLRRIVESICSAGARLATPGEFTLRAVAHGKMDLTQAEAVKDFIDAQTEYQAKTALRQLDGSLSKHIRPIKDALVDLIAQLEAGIDFAEDDVEVPANPSTAVTVEALSGRLDKLKDSFRYGVLLNKGVRLAIIGKPNVGKSSLFNRLISANRAIVTDIPGTTRDVLTETVSIDGVPIRFADTAGIRDSSDEVERLGVGRAFETLAEADLALVVLDGSCRLDDNDRQAIDRAKTIPHFVVINKNDLPPVIDLTILNGAPRVSVNTITELGVEALTAAIRAFFLSRKTSLADDLTLTNTRQFEAISDAASALSAAANALVASVPHEMVLLDLYRALTALGELTGETVTEDILGRIFATFCVGK